MKLRIECVCRGSRKIFVLMNITGSSPENTISIAPDPAHTPQIPCALYPYGSRATLDVTDYRVKNTRFVAVFPDMSLPKADFIITETSVGGSVTDRFYYTLSFSKATWESRLNYKLRPKLCENIRNYDEKITAVSGKHTAAGARFTFTHAITGFVDTPVLIRGKIFLPANITDKIILKVLSTSAEIVSTHSYILKDRYITNHNFSFLRRREIHFSVEVPDFCQDLIFVAIDKSSGQQFFDVLIREHYTALTDNWKQLTCTAIGEPDYQHWLIYEHCTTADILTFQRKNPLAGPSFSIICPLYNTPLDFFSDMVQSVISQTYPRWELILVNASPQDRQLKKVTKATAKSEPRIKLVELSQNLGISENTNAGITAATGDFLCFLDHDDFIEPDTLYEYAATVIRDNKTDLIYCDEDKYRTDKNGRGIFSVPFFKPDFNVDLLRSYNYITHMLCIKSSLYNTLTPSTAEFDGAQDHHMTLQATEKARCIQHIPRILYHWRMSPASTSEAPESKVYTSQAGVKAVQAHLDRLRIAAKVTADPVYANHYLVDYILPENHPPVSIIIPNKDSLEVLERCITSILEYSTYDNYEIIIMENNSTKAETFAYYQSLQQTYPETIRLTNCSDMDQFNFSKLINAGVAAAKGSIMLLLNNDTEVITPDWIEQMLGICLRDDVGIVGARLLFPDGTIQHAGINCHAGFTHLFSSLRRPDIRPETGSYFGLLDAVQDLSAVTAACMMVKKSVFEEVGGFSENLAVAYNDVDFCLKARKHGHLVVYTPRAELYHYESYSRGDDSDTSMRMRFFSESFLVLLKHLEYAVSGDPYINPNISTAEMFRDYYQISKERP